MPPILIVGGGVSGLTCGVRLLEAGYDVEIWAREQTPNTTSDVAAAVWYPLRDNRDERSDLWLKTSYARFGTLAEDPATGIVLRGGIELFREPAEDTWRSSILPGFRHARPDELPEGCASGFVAESIPTIEMPLYMAWLTSRLTSLGGRIVSRAISSFDEAFGAHAVVVNCAGLGARELAEDTSVHAIRGQVVRVAQIGLERYILDEENPNGVAYVYPRSADIVLGGTREPGNESTDVDEETSRAILARCADLEPRLAGARVLSTGVGLRPGRPSVCVEAEETVRGLLVHDYGHGGSGVMLSWGCAEDVLGLISKESGVPAKLD